MVEHGSFAHFVRSSVPVYGTGHGSRVLQLASFNFDASILEWSSALAAGATLCFADAPQALVGDYLADVIEQNAISFMQITPSALATVPIGRQLSSLRRVSVGGEAVPAQVLETWRERIPIINSYGPTETRCVSVIAIMLREQILFVLSNPTTIVLPWRSRNIPKVVCPLTKFRPANLRSAPRYTSVIRRLHRFCPMARRAKFVSEVKA